MNIGFIKSKYPNERRIALLPAGVPECFGRIIIEEGYGESIGISDEEYMKAGATIAKRASIFRDCDYLHCLKLLQADDYQYLRKNQTIIGWTHPTGSGADFFKTVCQQKELNIVDLDSQFPKYYYMDTEKDLTHIIPKGFIDGNSRLAGFSSVQHALLSFGIAPTDEERIAVLSVGNVSQGALRFIQRFSCNVDIFTRSNMDKFLGCIGEYDIIINGIESDSGHVVGKDCVANIKKGCLVIDAAADAGGAIYGTKYTRIDSPLYESDGVFYYVVNNSPSLLYRQASKIICDVFTKYIYSRDPNEFIL